MPTFGRLGNYKIKIYARDHNPPHVHFETKETIVRIDLVDVSVMSVAGRPTKKAVELMLFYVEKYRMDLVEIWNELQTKN